MSRILCLILVICTLSLRAELLHEWNPETGVKNIYYPNSNIRLETDDAGVMQQGKPTFRFTVIRAGNTVPHALQINFAPEEGRLTPGSHCRLSFEISADRKVELPMSVRINRPPYNVLGNSYRVLSLSPEWQAVEVEFPIPQQTEGGITAPMLMVGKLPEGTVLRIGAVRVEDERKHLPLALNPEWRIFLRPAGFGKQLETMDAVPETFGGVTGSITRLSDTTLDLAGEHKLAGETAVLFNQFDSAADGVMQVGCGADWWFDFYSNGKLCYSTGPAGNQNQNFSPENHVFDFPVRKGHNLVAVVLKSGASGWRFECGIVPFRQVRPNSVVRLRTGKEWKPIKMESVDLPPFTRENYRNHPKGVRLESVQVKPGTALDLSGFLPEPDIDGNGRVIAAPSGHLSFEKTPDIPVRFRGFNMMSLSGEAFAGYSDRELEQLAEQFRLRGMNVVRLHFLSDALTGPRQPVEFGGKSLRDTGIPLTVSELPVNTKVLDRYQYFTKCLRDRGVYLLLDILTGGHHGWTAASLQLPLEENWITAMHFDRRYRDNWKAGFQFLMTAINPYTGRAMKDDPQLLGVTFINEQDIQPRYLAVFSPHWKKFRNPEAPETVPDLTPELVSGTGEEARAARKCLLKLMEDLNRFYLNAAAEIGCRAIATQWDMFLRLIDTPPRTEMSAVAMHTYFAHPQQGPLSTPEYRQKRSDFWMIGRELSISQSSALSNNSYLGHAAMTRLAGKPFLLTEYAHSSFNRYAHEEGLMVGGYAALQGWDLLTPHADLIFLDCRAPAPYDFDGGLNPVSRANEVVTHFAWQRGDVAAARHRVAFRITPELVDSPNVFDAVAPEYNSMFMLTGIESTYPASSPGAVLDIVPEFFSKVGGSNMSVELRQGRNNREIQAKIVRQLRDRRVLPEGNHTDVGYGLFHSETGEILTDVRNHRISITTARLEGTTVKKDAPAKLGALEILSASQPAAITAVSLDREPAGLADSKRILLIINTRSLPDQAVFSDETLSTQIDPGTFPPLIRTGRFVLRLKRNGAGTFRCHALNLDGTRERELPVESEGDSIRLDIDTSQFEYGTPFFELER